MLKVDRGRKRELGEDVGEHLRSGDPNDRNIILLDQVTNEVVLDVNVLERRDGHVIGSERDAAFVVFKGRGRKF